MQRVDRESKKRLKEKEEEILALRNEIDNYRSQVSLEYDIKCPSHTKFNQVAIAICI